QRRPVRQLELDAPIVTTARNCDRKRRHTNRLIAALSLDGEYQCRGIFVRLARVDDNPGGRGFRTCIAVIERVVGIHIRIRVQIRICVGGRLTTTNRNHKQTDTNENMGCYLYAWNCEHSKPSAAV